MIPPRAEALRTLLERALDHRAQAGQEYCCMNFEKSAPPVEAGAFDLNPAGQGGQQRKDDVTTDSDTSRKVNRSIELANGSMFYLADGATCPQCGVILRAIDAEPLLPGVRAAVPQ